MQKYVLAEVFVQPAVHITAAVYQGHIHLNNICDGLIVTLESMENDNLSIDKMQSEMNQKLEKIETALEAFHVRKEYAGHTFLLRGIALVGEKLPQKLTFAELAEKVSFQEHLDTKTVNSKLGRAVSTLWRAPGNWTLLHQIEGEGALPENAEPIDVIYSLAYYVKEQSNN